MQIAAYLGSVFLVLVAVRNAMRNVSHWRSLRQFLAQEPDGWMLDEAITVEEALRLMTINTCKYSSGFFGNPRGTPICRDKVEWKPFHKWS